MSFRPLSSLYTKPCQKIHKRNKQITNNCCGWFLSNTLLFNIWLFSPIYQTEPWNNHYTLLIITTFFLFILCQSFLLSLYVFKSSLCCQRRIFNQLFNSSIERAVFYKPYQPLLCVYDPISNIIGHFVDEKASLESLS